jgi:hypothetical protein
MGFTLDETIRPIAVNSENGSAGIGYITIPDNDNTDRDQFVEDCYRSNTVALLGGINHSFFCDVSIDKEVLKSIEFPKNKGQMGSPVVWVNIPSYNKPIVIAVLKCNGDYYLNAEGEWNLSREFNGNHIDISAKSKEGVLNFSVIATGGKIKFNIIDANKNGEFNIYVKGKSQIHATEETQIISDKKIQFAVVDEDSKNRVVITYERDRGFTYIDEYSNEINIKDGQIQFKSDKINHNDGNEPMVLGNTLKGIVSDLCDAISALTVTCAGPGNPSSPPVNLAQFTVIKTKLKTMLSKKSNLD